MNPLVPVAPKTTYYDVLRMALFFDDWYTAFITLMGIFELPVVEFPSALRAQVKGKEAYKVPNDLKAAHPVSKLNPLNQKTSLTSNMPQPNIIIKF